MATFVCKENGLMPAHSPSAMPARPRKFAGILLTLLLLAALLLPVIPAAAKEQDLSAFVRQGMDLWRVPGMAVTVVNSEEVLYRESFGMTAIESGAPIDENTLFAIASTTKAMVAAAILVLADEGKLSLDDKVTDHIPELHFNSPLLTAQITLRDLLAHRTGLPSTDFWSFFLDMPVDEQIRRLAEVPPSNPLRTGFIYQNTMFDLAGIVIERVSGLRWDRFVAQRLWQPLGMRHTFGARSAIPGDLQHVLPYQIKDGELIQSEWDTPADMAAASGTVWSTILDMGRWAQFLLRGGVSANGDRLLSESAVEEMFKPQQLIPASEFYPASSLSDPSWRTYGLAWFQQDFQGRKIDFHTGSLSGLIALIGLDRASDRAVVILGNRDHAEMRHAVLWQVMDQHPHGPRRDWNQDVWNLYKSGREAGRDRWADIEKSRLDNTRMSLLPKAYAGRYENPAMGEVQVIVDGRRSVLNAGAIAMPMSHWHIDTFLVEYEPWEMKEFATFNIGPDGEVTSMDLFEFRFERLPPED